MNQSSNTFTLDLSANLQNAAFQEILTKILSLSKGQPSNTAILRVGTEMISLNITKILTQSQEQISNPMLENSNESSTNLINSDSKKIETLDNSDSLVRHMSDKEDTKQYLTVSNNIPIISKCETYPKNIIRSDQRHFSMDSMIKQQKKEKPKSFSQKAFNDDEMDLKFTKFGLEVIENVENFKKRKYSNDIDFSLSMSKESIGTKRQNSKLMMTKGDSSMTFNKEGSLPYHKEISMNINFEKPFLHHEKTRETSLKEKTFNNKDGQMPYAREISLNFSKDKDTPLSFHRKENSSNFGGGSLNLLGSLSMSKGLSSNKYKISSDDNDIDKKKNQLIALEHESFNTLDFNVSKSDSKSGSPMKKPMLHENFITIENQEAFPEDNLKPSNAKSEENTGFPDMDLDKMDISKSLYIMDNSGTLKNQDAKSKDGRYSSPLGINKRNEGSTNTRYVPQKNLIDSKSFSNISESVDTVMKKSGEEEYLAAIQSIQELMKTSDKNSKAYMDFKKTIDVMGKFNERIIAKELQLNSKEMELAGIEKTLKEKEKKINELLEKTSKSSTQWFFFYH